MPRSIDSIQTRLTVSFGILVLVMTGFSVFYTFNETKKAIKKIMRNELQAIAGVAAQSINGDILEKFKPGDEGTESFGKLRDALYRMEKSNPDIKYIYTYRLDRDGKITFIVDAEYGKEADPARIGELYRETTPAMLDGVNKITSDSEFTSDKWGTFISGYAPIRNSKGAAVGAVGIDMLKATLVNKENFMGDTIYFILAASIVITAVMILLFTAGMIRDIRAINDAAGELGRGNPDIKLAVKRRDEIGELAAAIKRISERIRALSDKEEDL